MQTDISTDKTCAICLHVAHRKHADVFLFECSSSLSYIQTFAGSNIMACSTDRCHTNAQLVQEDAPHEGPLYRGTAISTLQNGVQISETSKQTA
jgi:hypothetical protein